MESVSGALNPASISALAAIFGSLVGAFGSAVTTWIGQRHQDRRDLLAKKIFHREQLYSEFISESAKVIVDAAQHTFQDPSRLIPMYAVLGHIRLSSSPSVVESAERLVKLVLNAYLEPNLTPEDSAPRRARATTHCASLATFVAVTLNHCGPVSNPTNDVTKKSPGRGFPVGRVFHQAKGCKAAAASHPNS